MPAQVLEGTWEEVVAHADELTGKHIKVIVVADVPETVEQPHVGPPNMGPPNEKALAVLAVLEERHQGRRETSGEDTQRMIREGRAGGMYGLEPVDD